MAFDGEILDFIEGDLIEINLSETEDFAEDETTVHISVGLDTTGAVEGDTIIIDNHGIPVWGEGGTIGEEELAVVANDAEAFAFFIS